MLLAIQIELDDRQMPSCFGVFRLQHADHGRSLHTSFSTRGRADLSCDDSAENDQRLLPLSIRQPIPQLVETYWLLRTLRGGSDDCNFSGHGSPPRIDACRV